MPIGPNHFLTDSQSFPSDHQVSIKLHDLPRDEEVPEMHFHKKHILGKSPIIPKGPCHQVPINIGGTTGGVISSGEDDEKDLEDDDEDDIIGEDKRLMEDVKLTAEDIVIVATFKLPITVYRD